MARVRNYKTLDILENGMAASALRHSILADNISNVDTPGFKRSDVDFEHMLARALEGGPRIELGRDSERHFETMPPGEPDRVHARVFAELDTWTRNDQNNVDPEIEMTNMAKNTLYYQTVAQRVASSYRGLTQILRQTPQL